MDDSGRETADMAEEDVERFLGSPWTEPRKCPGGVTEGMVGESRAGTNDIGAREREAITKPPPDNDLVLGIWEVFFFPVNPFVTI